MRAQAPLAVFMASLLVWFPTFSLTAGNSALGKVVPSGPADLNGTRLAIETTVYGGDTISTETKGLALVLLPQGDQLHLGPSTEVQVTARDGSVFANLARGAVLARSGRGQALSVWARGLAVNPQAQARYEVVVADTSVLVATQEGAVTVQGTNRTVTVSAGKAMRFEVAPAAQGPAGTGRLNLTSGQSAVIAAAAAGGGAFLLAWFISKNQAEDDACATVRRTVSPSNATFRCP